MPLGRLASGSWSQLSTPTLDKTRPLPAGTMESISTRGQKSSAACEMTRRRRLITRQLFGKHPEKCRNQPFKITEKCRNRHLQITEKCRIRRSQHPEKCNRMTKRHVEAGVACGRFSSPQPSLLVVFVVGVALEGVDVQVLVVVLRFLRCRFGRGGAAE